MGIFDAYNLALSQITCPYGNGCIGGGSYEMFQQAMRKPIVRNGNYKMSAFAKKANGGTEDKHLINWILSSSQPHYLDESCPNTIGTGDAYKAFSNISFGTIGTVATLVGDMKMSTLVDNSTSYLSDWTFIEIPFTPKEPHFKWFSVASNDINSTVDEVSPAPYFAFDEIYIDEEGCYCPRVEVITDQTLVGPMLIRAQETVIVGKNVTISNSSSGKVIFRANNSINFTPGFEARYGSLFETQKMGCYDDEGEILATTVTGFTPNCNGINDFFAFRSRNATSYSLLWAERYGTHSATITGEIIYNNPDSLTHINPPLTGTGNSVYIFTLTVFGCNDVSYTVTGNCTVLDATEGCFNSFKTHTDSVETNSDENSLSKIQDINIFPNPSCSELTVQIDNFAESGYMTITNIGGQILREINMNKASEKINIGNFAEGIYFVNYFSSNYKATKKLIKICAASKY